MKKSIAVFGVICSLILISGNPANALDPAPPDTLELLQDVTAQSDGSTDTAVLEGVSDVRVEAGEDTVVQVAGQEVVLPADTTGPLTVGELNVSLPDTATPAVAEPVTAGVAEYKTDGGFSTVPIVKDDGSVQVLTIIDGASAPIEFTYDFELPHAATLTDAGGGAIAIYDGAGGFLGGVAPAWAVDASGKAVATHYELRGSRLVQIVEHRAAGVVYPVTADPWLGSNLFGVSAYNPNVPGYWMTLSTWGHAVRYGLAQGGGPGAVAAGQAIFYGAGWDEIRNRHTGLNSKATYHQQYDCHVLGAYYPAGGPTWDLEGNRANRPNWLSDGGAWTYHCNWP